MHNNINIGVIACDLRQLYMAKMLATHGYNVYLIYSEMFENDKSFKDKLCEIVFDSDTPNLRISNDITEIIDVSDIISGPVPMSKISEFMILPKFIGALVSKEHKENFLFYAGMIDTESLEVLEKASIRCIDYMKSDKLTIFNTIATAEGIIAEAVIHKNTNLHGSKTLVLGYGKCAKTLAHKLSGLSADVTITARNNDELEAAYSLGYKTLNLSQLKEKIVRFEYIFNTIPALVLNDELLEHVNHDSLILDISSSPGCVDKNAALKYGISVYHSLGIPGRFAPKSSGEAIGNHLIEIISKYSLHKINV